MKPLEELNYHARWMRQERIRLDAVLRAQYPDYLRHLPTRTLNALKRTFGTTAIVKEELARRLKSTGRDSLENVPGIGPKGLRLLWELL